MCYGEKACSVRDKLGIYVPQERLWEELMQLLIKQGRERERPVSYAVLQAILGGGRCYLYTPKGV